MKGVIVETLKSTYFKIMTLETKKEAFDKEIGKIIAYMPKIFLSLAYIEFNLIKANPRVLLTTDKNIFELIEELSKKTKVNTLISSSNI